MDKVLRGIRTFRERVFPGHQQLFERLRSGQKPRLLFITCSDSRIDPSLITQTEPGELFVVRNAGNLVPPATAGAGAEAAAIEYAIDVLAVRHAVVCGHSHCGAMAALGEPSATERLPALRAWLDHARPALEREARFVALEDESLRRVAANVGLQLEQLRSHRAVANAERRGALAVHGWIYRFELGDVLAVDPCGSVEPLGESPSPSVATA